MIEKVLDEYEIKARMAPGIILTLPIIVACIYVSPALGAWPIFATAGACCLVLFYGLSYLVRNRGIAVEPSLWSEWGGPPSTRFMRHRDSTLPEQTKSLIRAEVEKKFSIVLLSSSEERSEPARADRTISDSFRRVRQYLRQRNPTGLWFKHNVEYGFCRNLLGCRTIVLSLGAASTIFTAWYGQRVGAGVLNTAASIEVSFTLCAICYGWWLLPDSTKRTAEAYAEAAWVAFLDLNHEAEIPASSADTHWS